MTKLAEAREHGAQFTINAATEDFQAKVLEYTHGRGATVSIDAACVKNSLLLLLQATGNAGRVITMGFSTAPTEVKPVPDHFQRAGCERFPPPE